MSSVGETAVGRQPGASLLGLHARRMWKDRLFRWAMAAGGTAVFVALLLIFVYLLYVVAPIFAGATVHPATESPLAAGAGATRHIALDEYAEVALRVTDAGRYSFIRTATNEVIESRHFAGLETGDAPVEQLRVVAGDPGTGLIAVASRAGVLLAQSSYSVSYPGDVRLVTPAMTYPFGPVPIVIGGGGDLPAALAVQALEDEAVIVALDRNGRLQATRVTRELNFLTEEVSIEQETEQLAAGLVGATMLRLAEDLRSLIVADEVGGLTVYDIRAPGNATAWPRVQVTAGAARTTALEFLSGASSIVVGESSGTISQWFPVRGENGQPALTRIRDFTDLNAPVASIVPEHDRKGFIAITESGDIGVYHATAHRTLARTSFSDGRPTAIGISPRADRLIAVTADDKLTQARIENEHPEISLHALWQKVWYESRAEPQYIWQSSSASSDFEPKFSLMPLTFGTLKAAFYAMLFAVPMAVLGAIYTAYFMSAPMRRIVKPSIEIMEALPTVILGFLAGLWFAPFVERNMPGFFLIMLLLPPALIGAGYLWRFAPHRVRHRFPDGSEALLLLPVVCLTIAVAIALSGPVEEAFFGGNMPAWITEVLGLDFDQRNSLIVGVAMGFAVIPTIFSISEDAVFGVPRSLTTSSLALGATPWQTMIKVVILTASPGIFSAILIGLGRAVGETMIVLMATGNTPIMDANIFQGFRALSANIAVEMPESEVGSTHYRILFLAALVLFLATFVFNTMGEIVRQRLRARYSGL